MHVSALNEQPDETAAERASVSCKHLAAAAFGDVSLYLSGDVGHCREIALFSVKAVVIDAYHLVFLCEKRHDLAKIEL